MSKKVNEKGLALKKMAGLFHFHNPDRPDGSYRAPGLP
jgi:hypothetical protein